MAVKTYIGVGDTAKSVSKIYVGVGDVAKQVKKAYIGDADGLAQLVYQYVGGPYIPTTYQQVEYVRNYDGKAYINLGFVANQNTGFDISYICYASLGTGGFGNVFGSRASSSSRYFALSSYTRSGTGGGSMGFYNTETANVGMTSGTRITHSLRNGVLTKPDGTTVTLTSGTFTTPANLWAFAANQNGSIMQNGYNKFAIYSLKFYDSTTLIHNYYPCYRKSDAVIGLYDLVDGAFLTNSVGTLTKGDDYEAEL